jgi:hypothetical protein
MLRRVLPALLLLTAVVPCAAVTPDQGIVLDGGEVGPARVEATGTAELPLPDLSFLALNAEPATFSARLSLDAPLVSETQTPLTPRPRAFDYSDAYRTRAKIHKCASFATLPLFVAQFAVGQKLYNGNGSDSTRSAHSALAASTGVLFGVNSVTGVWNLHEGRKDPNRRTKRVVHGVLMLVADAGFVATGALAPDDEGEGGVSRSTHRTIALSSMGVATVSYLIMLLAH